MENETQTTDETAISSNGALVAVKLTKKALKARADKNSI